jgi:hypothetical protein
MCVVRCVHMHIGVISCSSIMTFYEWSSVHVYHFTIPGLNCKITYTNCVVYYVKPMNIRRDMHRWCQITRAWSWVIHHAKKIDRKEGSYLFSIVNWEWDSLEGDGIMNMHTTSISCMCVRESECVCTLMLEYVASETNRAPSLPNLSTMHIH